MKKISLIICLMIMSNLLSAQPFHVNTNVISLGVGLGSSIGNYTTTAQSPGIHATYERGVWQVRGVDVISLGGYVGYKGFKNEFGVFGYNYTQKWNYTSIGVKANYHYNGFTKLPKLDVYGGVMTTFDILNYTYDDNDPGNNQYVTKDYNSSVSFSMMVGGRYFFTDSFGVYSELGYGVNFFTAGVCFKF